MEAVLPIRNIVPVARKYNERPRRLQITKSATKGRMNFFLPCFATETAMESKIEVFVERYFVLPVLEEAVCLFDEGAFANETLGNRGGSL